MKNETLYKKIMDMIEGKPARFSKGCNRFSLMSERQQGQLFGMLHREFNAQSMDIIKLEDRKLSILVRDHERQIIIKSTIETY